MREILFRGKVIQENVFAEDDKPIGTWVHGDLLTWRGGAGVWEGHLQFIVDPETVGQYTGLKDKNGVRIFEGDIVKAWSEGAKAVGVIKQRIDGLWLIYPAWQDGQSWGLCPTRDGKTTVEVIGNVHDNPELLEEVE